MQYNREQVMVQREAVNKSRELILASEKTLGIFESALAEQRGLFLTGDSKYWDRFNQNKENNP